MARTRFTRRLIAIALSSTILTATIASSEAGLAQPVNPDDSEIATAESNVNTNSRNVAQLANTLSNTQNDISHLENEMGGLREAVNKALVDLHDAQASAEQARQAARAARQELDDVQNQMTQAQQRLDEFSRSAYRKGASNPGVSGAAGTKHSNDALDRQTYLRTNIAKQRAIIDHLDHLRTDKANKESQLREASKLAEQREAQAAQAKEAAQNAINENSRLIEQRTASLKNLMAQRDDAQKKLDAAKSTSDTLNNQRKEYQDYQKAKEERERAEAEAAAAEKARHDAEQTQADAQARADAEADAAATANDAHKSDAEERARTAADEAERARTDTQEKTTQAQQAQQHHDAATAAAADAATKIAELSPDHTNLDSPYPTDLDADDATIAALQGPQQDNQQDDAATGSSSSSLSTLDTVTSDASASVSGSKEEKIEAVIARAQSQVGLPYAWGGGNASGPTQGIRDGGVADSFGDYNKVGFDCSGLVLYAFAGVGIALPHYTGYQYERGTKISPNEIQRGDLIFYGPNAEDHVAIYLGDGQMLEAPQSGSQVQVSPVRWTGMSPYAVRLI